MSSEWTQVIINTTILIIYLFMLRSNVKMVTETKEMAKESKLTREQAYRPEVIAYVREENELLYFRVQNIGTRPAFNTHIKIENFFYNTELDGSPEEHERFLMQIYKTARDVEKKIYFLAPNQSIEAFMGVREFIVKRNLNGISERKLKLTYFNYEEEVYVEEYKLSLRDFSKKSFLKRDSLGEMADELKAIKMELYKRENI